MLAGEGPILGEGLAGYFIDPDNNKIAWYYNDGASLIDDYQITKVNSPYSLLRSDPKVAILTDRFTASSGESIVVAFIGRSNTKRFGSPTTGLTTANSTFELNDGAIIVLAVSTVADRTGKLYGNKIDPDQNAIDSEILDLCIEWILN
jgi:C-terminal processing protease CtpA/Prc